MAHVKRVLLPSGKTIEVVYFQDGQVGGPGIAAAGRPIDGGRELLHLCPECQCDMVYPVEWDEAGPQDWEVLLRCPNCWAERQGVYSQEEVELFDEILDRGSDSLASGYKRLMRANMAEEIDRFAAAIHAGHVLPEDF